MLSVRTKLGLSQKKVADILDIAGKSYNNYEHEKRELPLSIAVKFCDAFDVNFPWLIYGLAAPDPQESAELCGEAAKAVYEFVVAHEKTYSSTEVKKFVRYIIEQSISKGTSPRDEAALFFSAIG